jgi:uncharacterized membrane protein YbhN (UPF0104 family)
VQPDTELETWRRQWQAQDGVPLDLRQRVEHEIRMGRLGLVGAIAVTVSFGLGIPAWAFVSRRADVAVLAAAVWVFIAINWTVSRSLGRGVSRPVATTAAAFLDFSILSCQRRHRSIAAASVLYAAMLTFNLAWVYQAQPMPLGVWLFLTREVAWVFVITAALAMFALWRRRKLERELSNLLTLRRQLDAPGERRA